MNTSSILEDDKMDAGMLATEETQDCHINQQVFQRRKFPFENFEFR